MAEIMHMTAGSEVSLQYRTSLEEATGETTDISEYLDFEFYDWCWYNDNTSLKDTKLVKFLGVSHLVGRIMSYWVIAANGTFVLRKMSPGLPISKLKRTKIRQGSPHWIKQFRNALMTKLTS